MVVDASAILAMLLNEAEASLFLHKLRASQQVWISPVNWWEVHARVVSSRGLPGTQTAAAWMASAGIVIEPVTIEQTHIAVWALERYGRRPARLNMGDCFAYALARAKNAPLLFKGGDFIHTDVRRA